MIVLNLSCESDHLFEGWFASSDAFEVQCRKRLITCPVCSSAEITRRPSAPYVNTGSAPLANTPPTKPAATPAADPNAVAVAMALLRQLGNASEDVGKRFAEEARRIHYGDAESRNIKGQASRTDVTEMLEEGILVMPLPDDVDLH